MAYFKPLIGRLQEQPHRLFTPIEKLRSLNESGAEEPTELYLFFGKAPR